MRGTLDRRETPVEEPLGKPFPRRGECKRIAAAGDDERRMCDLRHLGAQIARGKRFERADERFARRLASRKDLAPERRKGRATMLAALELQRKETLDGELPRDLQFVAEASERKRGCGVRPIDRRREPWRGRHEHEAPHARRLLSRPAHRDEAAERPAEHG